MFYIDRGLRIAKKNIYSIFVLKTSPGLGKGTMFNSGSFRTNLYSFIDTMQIIFQLKCNMFKKVASAFFFSLLVYDNFLSLYTLIFQPKTTFKFFAKLFFLLYWNVICCCRHLKNVASIRRVFHQSHALAGVLLPLQNWLVIKKLCTLKKNICWINLSKKESRWNC
jgi:hypothetical protein